MTGINEAKKSVSGGKAKVAAAIAGKGIQTAADSTFGTLADNIGKITTLSFGSADATAGAAQILNGYYAYVKGAKVDGSMPNHGAVSHSLAANGSYTIPAGYHNGGGKVTQSLATQGAQTITPGTADKTIAANRYLTGVQTIKGDANLVAANIVKGKSIFGVAGTHTGGNFYCKQLLSNADASATIPKESVYLDFIPAMAAVIRICTIQYSQYGYANGTAVKVIIPTRPNSSFRDQTNIYTSGSVALPEGTGGSTILDLPINIYMTSQNKHVWLGTGDNNNGDLISPITLGNSNNNVWLVIC